MPRPNKGPRIEINGRGVYEIRWSENRRSRRLSTGTSDMAQAQQALAGFLSEAQRPENQTLTIGELLDVYAREHVAEHVTDAERQRIIIRWLKQGLGGLLVDELTDTTLRTYKDKRRRGIIGSRGTTARRGRNGVSDSTLRRELNTLRAAFGHARRTRRITAGQMPYIALPKSAPPKDFYLSQAETAQLMACAQTLSVEAGRLTRAHRFLALALATAARKHAIVSLTWDLVEFEQGLVRYDRLPGDITKKRRVAVPIADWLRPILELAHAERADGSAYVLDGTQDVRWALETVCKRAAKQHDNARFLQVNPHSLRHTAATHMAQAGIEPFFIAGVLGDSIATVMKVYAKQNPDYLRDAVNAMGASANASAAQPVA